MTEAAQNLRARRLELIRRAAAEREDLRNQIHGIQATLGNLAGGLSRVRWLSGSPLLLAGGALVTMIVGRGRLLRTLGAGMAMVGILRRYRDAFRVVGQLVSASAVDQPVRRSR